MKPRHILLIIVVAIVATMIYLRVNSRQVDRALELRPDTLEWISDHSELREDSLR